MWGSGRVGGLTPFRSGTKGVRSRISMQGGCIAAAVERARGALYGRCENRSTTLHFGYIAGSVRSHVRWAVTHIK